MAGLLTYSFRRNAFPNFRFSGKVLFRCRFNSWFIIETEITAAGLFGICTRFPFHPIPETGLKEPIRRQRYM